MSDKTMTPEQISAALAAPFSESEIRWRKGTRGGLMLPYITAASVIRRLNDVLGIDGWWDRYRVQSDGAVLCRLTILVGGHWVSREDVGVPSTTEGQKGSRSDALKRAARKFGIGLHLQFLDKQKAPAAAELARGSANGPPPAHTMPRTGEELEQRLKVFDDRLAAEGLILDGDLLLSVSKAVAAAGHGLDTRTWKADAITLAVNEAVAFERRVRSKAQDKEARRQRIAGKTGV
jgi:hypothetical protein